MNAVIEVPRREAAGLVASEVHRYSAVEIRERVNLVQEVMRGIMKEGTHFGTIPGTPKPTLYKPGAEVLCVTFRIAQEYRIEDLSDAVTARYRVVCIGRHQVTGLVLGEGVGECSSAEEKYKWRAAVCTEEFDLTPETMRRLKFSKYQGNVSKKIQVRTEAADLANTVLKMACKRAMIAMTLNVTAASDIFTQDYEDLPEDLRQHDSDAPALSELGQRLVAQVQAAKTAEEVEAIWKAGVKEINAAKDVTAQEAFKAAVVDRGAALKAAKAGQPAEQTQQAASAAPSGPLADLLADMEATADSGLEALETGLASLSKQSQENMAPHLDALRARARAADERGAA